MSRLGRQRPPLVPADRLKPPKLEWAQELDRRRQQAAAGDGEAADAPVPDAAGAALGPAVPAVPVAPVAPPDALPGPESRAEPEPSPGPESEPSADARSEERPLAEAGQQPQTQATDLEPTQATDLEPAQGTDLEPTQATELESTQATVIEPVQDQEPLTVPDPQEGAQQATEQQPAGDLEAGPSTPVPAAEPERAPAALHAAAARPPSDDRPTEGGAPAASTTGDTEGPLVPGPADRLPLPVAPLRASPGATGGRPASGWGRSGRAAVSGYLTGSPGRAASIALIVVLSAACLVLVILNVVRIAESGAEASRQAAGYSPPVLPASGAPAAVSRVTVLGEKGTTDVEAVPGVRLLEKGLDGATVRVTAAEGARYVSAKGKGGDTFEAMAKTVPSGSTIVAVVGGSNDRSASLPALATAAARTIAAIEKRAPSAQIVIVGPLAPGTTKPAQDLIKVRNTLRAAAATASVHWVDPIAGKWLARSTVGSNGALDKAGEAKLARRLTSALAPYAG